jgi:hypothetical protein
MSSLVLDPEKTALVLIDLQKGILAMPAVPHSVVEVVSKSSQLAKLFREKRGGRGLCASRHGQFYSAAG